MKKLFTLLTIAFTLSFIGQMTAQEIVSTDPENRVAIMEEFTGIYCGYCPQGHAIANQLIADNPGNFYAINVHVGGYAAPQAGSGHPDFRTVWGDAIVGQTGLTGYPMGSVSREVFEGGNTAMSRDVWATYSNQVMAQASPVNVATTAKWLDMETIEVKVEVYFTADVDAGSLLNVAFLESGVYGYQSGADESPNYNHRHILRDLLTGQWGENMEKGATGDFFEKTFSYKPGADYNPFDNELEIVAFVSKGTHQYIYSGAGAAIEGLPQESELAMAGDDALAVAEGQATAKEVTVTNKSEAAITYTMSIDKSADTPADWTVEITDPTEDTFTLAAGESAVVKFIVNPGETRGYSVVTVTAQESGSTYNLAYNVELTTVSTEFEILLLTTAKTGSTIPANTAPTLPIEIFSQFAAEFTMLNTILWDNGHDGAFSDANAVTIKNAVTGGVNVVLLGNLTSGQMNDAGGLAAMGVAFKGYCYTGYDAQAGQLVNFNIDLYDDDNIFGDYALNPQISGLAGYYITIFDVTDASKTKALFGFSDAGKYYTIVNNQRVDHDMAEGEGLFGFRYINGDQRVVYVAESPAMIKNGATASAVSKILVDFVMGLVSVEEFDAYFSNMTAAPNPFAATTTVEFNMTSTAVADMSIVDAAGTLVKDLGSKTLAAGQNIETINSDNLASGLYFFVVKTGTQTQQIKLVISK